MSSTRTGALRHVEPAVAQIAVVSALFALAYGLYLAGLDGYREAGTGKVVGIDFIVFWTAGRMVLDGAGSLIYDPDAFHAATIGYFGPGMSWLPWLYPPHILAFAVPLGALPYGVALAVWTFGGAAAFLAACLVGQDARRRLDLLAFVLPITLLVVYYGQISLWAGAFGIGALRLMDRRPLLAGLLLGLLTIKPHYGMLIPLLLLWQRRWSMIAVASLTFAALIALSFAMVELETWRYWATVALPEQYRWFFVDGRVFLSKMMSLSPLMHARFAGLDIATAEWVHKIVALGGVALFCVGLWKMDAARVRWLAIVALALVTPYFHSYDLPIYIAAYGLWLVERPTTDRLSHGIGRMVSLALPCLPYALLVAYALLDFVPPLAPILMLAVAVVMLSREAEIPGTRTVATA